MREWQKLHRCADCGHVIPTECNEWSVSRPPSGNRPAPPVHNLIGVSHILCGSGSVVERCLAKANVAGPNPVSRSNQCVTHPTRKRRDEDPWVRCVARRAKSSVVEGYTVSRSNFIDAFDCLRRVRKNSILWHHRQAVRLGSAKPSSPVRFWVVPPKLGQLC